MITCSRQVSRAAALYYGYASLLPAALYCSLWRTGSGAGGGAGGGLLESGTAATGMSLAQAACLVGYSLSWFLPLSVRSPLLQFLRARRYNHYFEEYRPPAPRRTVASLRHPIGGLPLGRVHRGCSGIGHVPGHES